ncbi:hypothetical protein ESCO_000858 [Escovopsis weberi]|uniref:F-box domain-containing protein n=1 Tax=Escovopsis weberi TaxID=150374 RepID=A0A0M9VU98_ESCWE|nr:hypothetical protein ESCO_000858 [Escovopsis weberi]
MDASAAPQEAPRPPSTEKTPVVPSLGPDSPFERLPDEIIEQILEAADPNGFSSLLFLNRKWREVSQRAHLYRHHLARCPSFVAKPNTLPAAEDKNLPRLRRLFSREVKRNLFHAYIRPNRTLVKLVSNSISSSSFLGGESLSFSTSLRGHHVLAYNSSRIYVLDARGDARRSALELRRELRILRRPASACITDDATLLAVVSTEMQVDVYDLKASPPKRTQSIILDSNPRTIALSSCGSVLAAAYEAGIEVMALGTGALPSEKRSVKCDSVDALTFSFDGTQILGTTLQSSPPSTVVITAPYYDPGALMSDGSLSAMWTTSILFPNSSRDCSHAALLQDGHEEADWAFAYDRSFETFRAVRIDDLRNGTTYFTGPVPRSQAQLLPSTLPSATYHGELVSAAFHGSEIWLYGVPGDPAAVPEREPSTDGAAASGLARGNSSRSSSRPSSTRTQDAAAAAAAAAASASASASASATGRAPQWQMVCDRVRNNFVAGHKISELSDVTNAKWVSNFGGDRTLKERLVVTARGITGPKLITEEEDLVDYVDGGRVLLLDFDYSLQNGTRTEVTMELGTNDAEVLEEEKRDIETEVALARRRTVLQRRGGSAAGGGPGGRMLLSIVTSAQALAAARGARSDMDDNDDDNDDDDDDPLAPRVIGRYPASARPRNETPEEASGALLEAQEALDAPYAHSSPRSGTTLRRAATAAAANRRLNPRTADGRPLESIRADGRREHPHESDADNWVPPPPAYQADDPGDTPAFLRGPAILVAPTTSQGNIAMPPMVPPVQQHPVPPPPANNPDTRSRAPCPPALPTTTVPSEEAGASAPGDLNANESVTLQRSLPPSIYDVSPPDSPQKLIGQAGAASTLLTAPTLQARPSSTIPVSDSSSPNEPPARRRLSNASTWPLARDPAPPAPSLHHEIEQPLIISTPAGVSGAYDPPGRRTSRRGDMPILAPVPQRPQASAPNSSAPRSAVDRLETIFTAKPAEQPPAAAASKTSTSRLLLPTWMGRKQAAAPGRSASLVNRRPSRAGRSAAKNMQDARRRGWQAKGLKNKKKQCPDHDPAGGAGEAMTMMMMTRAPGGEGAANDWTDVPATPSVERPKDKDKDKKCVVM